MLSSCAPEHAVDLAAQPALQVLRGVRGCDAEREAYGQPGDCYCSHVIAFR